jgi:hypothetical protein
MLKWNDWKTMPALALLASVPLSSCSKNTFSKESQQTSAIAGQYITINPKLDLVIFQDDSDSMYNSLNQFEPQLQSFVTSLNSSWDYRVIVMPLLSSSTPVNSKAVIAADCTTVSGVWTCVNPSNIGYFNGLGGNQGWIQVDNSATGNNDWGFANMNYNINSLITAGFFRSDSMKAILVVSNGEDQSGLNVNNTADWQYQADGLRIGVNYNSSDAINSFNAYKSYFTSLKSQIGLNQFYSVVAAQDYSNCWGGGRTWEGLRYMNMAQVVGGQSFDLCNNGLPNVLNSIGNNLQTVVETVVFDYAVVSTNQAVQPDWSSLVITKNGATIPQDPNNGWEPVSGYQTNHATSDYPTVGNDQSGWMVQMNGTATYSGTDQISITFQNQ